jgi:hypothetical protein
MDISKITPNLLQGLEQKQTEQLQVLSRVLDLVVGKTQLATVIATLEVSKPEREVLIKQTTEALAQLQKQQAANPAAASPALKAEITRLTQQQQLLQSPSLKWVDLLVNNRQLTAYSDRPLKLGQPLLVQLQSPQKLVLLDDAQVDIPEPLLKYAAAALQSATAKTGSLSLAQLSASLQQLRSPSSTAPGSGSSTPSSQILPPPPPGQLPTQVQQPASIQQPASNQTSSAPDAKTSQPLGAAGGNNAQASRAPALPDTHSNQSRNNLGESRPQIAVSAQELAKKFSVQPQVRQETTNQPQKTLVNDNLRRLLPHRDAPEQLFTAIQLLQRMSEAKQQQLLPISVEQALKSLATRLRTPSQLGDPKQLAQAIKDSGIFFEKKLQQMAPLSSPAAENTASGATEKAARAAKQSAMQPTGEPSPRIMQDTKGALLNLLNRASQELTGKPLTSEQAFKLLQQPLAQQPSTSFTPHAFTTTVPGQKSELAQMLAVFIRDLINKPVKTTTAKEMRTQLLGLIQQQAQHSLAKIQLQQLQAVHQELEASDTSSPTSSWHLEIPLRHQSEVQQLQLHIAREWTEEKNENDTSAPTNTKVRQWSVTLRFDLPTLGEFCAQLAIVGEQVNATLWASCENTYEQARQRLDSLRRQLEDEGIVVKSLQCLLGMPPPKPLSLSYSLIDVST